MSGQWKEVVRLTFHGQRFHDHALDLNAIMELSQFQKIVFETAKVLWRAANPGRERLPNQFEERIRLCLRKIEEGSAVVPLEVFVEESDQSEMFEIEPTEVNEAISLIHQVFQAMERDEPLPKKFPKILLPEYTQLGQSLADDEAINIVTFGREPAHVNRLTCSQLATFTETMYEDYVDITGEVLEADVRRGRFQIWLDEKTSITVSFSSEQENEVTNALRDHRTLRLQIIGRGEFSSQGKLSRIKQVEKLRLHPVGEVHDTTARPIEDILTDLAREIPEEDWKRLPSDLTDNLDYYIYRTPKR